MEPVVQVTSPQQSSSRHREHSITSGQWSITSMRFLIPLILLAATCQAAHQSSSHQSSTTSNTFGDRDPTPVKNGREYPSQGNVRRTQKTYVSSQEMRRVSNQYEHAQKKSQGFNEYVIPENAKDTKYSHRKEIANQYLPYNTQKQNQFSMMTPSYGKNITSQNNLPRDVDVKQTADFYYQNGYLKQDTRQYQPLIQYNQNNFQYTSTTYPPINRNTIENYSSQNVAPKQLINYSNYPSSFDNNHLSKKETQSTVFRGVNQFSTNPSLYESTFNSTSPKTETKHVYKKINEINDFKKSNLNILPHQEYSHRNNQVTAPQYFNKMFQTNTTPSAVEIKPNKKHINVASVQHEPNHKYEKIYNYSAPPKAFENTPMLNSTYSTVDTKQTNIKYPNTFDIRYLNYQQLEASQLPEYSQQSDQQSQLLNHYAQPQLTNKQPIRNVAPIYETKQYNNLYSSVHNESRIVSQTNQNNSSPLEVKNQQYYEKYPAYFDSNNSKINVFQNLNQQQNHHVSPLFINKLSNTNVSPVIDLKQNTNQFNSASPQNQILFVTHHRTPEPIKYIKREYPFNSSSETIETKLDNNFPLISFDSKKINAHNHYAITPEIPKQKYQYVTPESRYNNQVNQNLLQSYENQQFNSQYISPLKSNDKFLTKNVSQIDENQYLSAQNSNIKLTNHDIFTVKNQTNNQYDPHLNANKRSNQNTSPIYVENEQLKNEYFYLQNLNQRLNQNPLPIIENPLQNKYNINFQNDNKLLNKNTPTYQEQNNQFVSTPLDTSSNKYIQPIQSSTNERIQSIYSQQSAQMYSNSSDNNKFQSNYFVNAPLSQDDPIVQNVSDSFPVQNNLNTATINPPVEPIGYMNQESIKSTNNLSQIDNANERSLEAVTNQIIPPHTELLPPYVDQFLMDENQHLIPNQNNQLGNAKNMQTISPFNQFHFNQYNGQVYDHNSTEFTYTQSPTKQVTSMHSNENPSNVEYHPENSQSASRRYDFSIQNNFPYKSTENGNMSMVSSYTYTNNPMQTNDKNINSNIKTTTYEQTFPPAKQSQHQKDDDVKTTLIKWKNALGYSNNQHDPKANQFAQSRESSIFGTKHQQFPQIAYAASRSSGQLTPSDLIKNDAAPSDPLNKQDATSLHLYKSLPPQDLQFPNQFLPEPQAFSRPFPQQIVPYIPGPTTEGIPILRQSNEMGIDGSFSYESLTADQIHVSQHGHIENPGTDHEEQVMQGSYSYVGDDGKTYTVNYVADGRGFRATGDHLPTPPPIPEVIQRSIDFNIAAEEAGRAAQQEFQPLNQYPQPISVQPNFLQTPEGVRERSFQAYPQTFEF